MRESKSTKSYIDLDGIALVLRLVGVMNHTPIVSCPITTQGREPNLGEFVNKQQQKKKKKKKRNLGELVNKQKKTKQQQQQNKTKQKQPLMLACFRTFTHRLLSNLV